MKNYVRFKVLCAVLVMFFSIGLVTCAKHKTYWLHLRPHPVGEEGPTTKLTVGVLPFEDKRPSPQRLGKRVTSGGSEEPIRLESSAPANDVTKILLQILKARSIRTVELTSWDPTPENLNNLPDDVDIAIVGNTEALAVEAQSFTFKTTVRYRVKLSAKLGFRTQGKVVAKSVEVRPEETVVSFNAQKVEETLNEAVSSALNLLVEAAIAAAD